MCEYWLHLLWLLLINTYCRSIVNNMLPMPFSLMYNLWQDGCALTWVCLYVLWLVCWFVTRITQKLLDGLPWNFDIGWVFTQYRPHWLLLWIWFKEQIQVSFLIYINIGRQDISHNILLSKMVSMMIECYSSLCIYLVDVSLLCSWSTLFFWVCVCFVYMSVFCMDKWKGLFVLNIEVAMFI